MEESYSEQAQVMKAFCDENRLRILALLRGGEKCACMLLEHLNIGQPSLSYHMKILVDSGVVESRQQGKWTNYRLSAAGCERARVLLAAATTPDETAVDETCGE